MMLAYKVHKPIWKEDWGMSKLLKRVVVRYGARICAIAAMVATISPVCYVVGGSGISQRNLTA